MSVTLVKKFHRMKKFCWLQFLCWHHNLKAKIQGQTNGKNWAISCFLGFVCSSTFTRLCLKDFGIHMYGSIFAEWDDLTKLEANTSLRPVYSRVFHSFNVIWKNGTSVARLQFQIITSSVIGSRGNCNRSVIRVLNFGHAKDWRFKSCQGTLFFFLATIIPASCKSKTDDLSVNSHNTEPFYLQSMPVCYTFFYNVWLMKQRTGNRIAEARRY